MTQIYDFIDLLVADIAYSKSSLRVDGVIRLQPGDLLLDDEVAELAPDISIRVSPGPVVLRQSGKAALILDFARVRSEESNLLRPAFLAIVAATRVTSDVDRFVIRSVYSTEANADTELPIAGLPPLREAILSRLRKLPYEVRSVRGNPHA